jgi:hypothetical protein
MDQATALDLTLLIERLSAPVCCEEASEGWQADSKAAIRAYFVNRQGQAMQGTLEPDYGLVRGLDAWGISRGELHSMALRVNRLRP